MQVLIRDGLATPGYSDEGHDCRSMASIKWGLRSYRSHCADPALCQPTETADPSTALSFAQDDTLMVAIISETGTPRLRCVRLGRCFFRMFKLYRVRWCQSATLSPYVSMTYAVFGLVTGKLWILRMEVGNEFEGPGCSGRCAGVLASTRGSDIGTEGG